MNKGENSIIKEMISLILCCGLLLQIVLMFFVNDRLYVSVGLWIGIMLAIFMVVYMYRILQAGLGLESRSAEKYVLTHSVIRYVVVVVVYGIVIFAHLGSPLACFAGVLSLKVAAYLQPLYQRFKEGRLRK